MTQSPFDQLSKQYLEEFLAPIGTVERQYEVPGEAKYVDVWFIPDLNSTEPIDDLGLLGQMAKTPCLIEPFRNPPSREEIRTCLLKLLWIHEDQRRKQESVEENGPEPEAPTLWILASHMSKPLLKDFHAHKTMTKGVYKLGPGLRTMLVSIDELPKTQNTLWVRILGRDQTQSNAIQEIFDLPIEHPRRNKILRLLASWNVKIESGEVESFIGQEEIMGFSQAFLDWEEATEQRGITIGQQTQARSIVLRLLSRKLGTLPEDIRSQVEKLSLEQSEALGDALLDFRALTDLVEWLEL